MKTHLFLNPNLRLVAKLTTFYYQIIEQSGKIQGEVLDNILKQDKNWIPIKNQTWLITENNHIGRFVVSDDKTPSHINFHHIINLDNNKVQGSFKINTHHIVREATKYEIIHAIKIIFQQLGITEGTKIETLENRTTTFNYHETYYETSKDRFSLNNADGFHTIYQHGKWASKVHNTSTNISINTNKVLMPEQQRVIVEKIKGTTFSKDENEDTIRKMAFLDGFLDCLFKLNEDN